MPVVNLTQDVISPSTHQYEQQGCDKVGVVLGRHDPEVPLVGQDDAGEPRHLAHQYAEAAGELEDGVGDGIVA